MRQVGLLAAAGRHAIDNHVERLVEDHQNAELLAKGLADIDGIEVDSQNTNMVFVRTVEHLPELQQGLLRRGVQTRWSGKQSRMVLHLDVNEADVEIVLKAISEELNA